MLWILLQTICIGSLLVQAASECLSQAEVLNRIGILKRRAGLQFPKVEAQPKRTCAEAAREIHGGTNNRALSPWRYRLDQDQNRVPETISVAECLCDGCIVNRKEDHSYNSKPLTVRILVHKKTECKQDPNKYRMSRELVEVSVGCVCVTPKTHQQDLEPVRPSSL